MRISENRQVGTVRKASKGTRSASSGAVFSLDEAPENHQTMPMAQLGAPSSIGDISALLAVQGDDTEHKKRRAIKRGYQTLDALDALKVDVLSGQVSRQKLIHLAKIIEEQRVGLNDPALMNVLDHIDLRARVELAKFEQSRH